MRRIETAPIHSDSHKKSISPSHAFGTTAHASVHSFFELTRGKSWASRDPKQAILASFVLFAGGILSGAWTGAAAIARAQDPYSDLDVFARVLTTIESDYIEEIPTDRLIGAAIKGMVSELDPHTKWLSAEQVRQLRLETDGQYSGIGITIEASEVGAEVTKVFPNSPAQRDGVIEDDLIVSIDGKDLLGLQPEQIHKELVGPRGSEAFLIIRREGNEAPVEVSTVRDLIRIPAIESHWIEPNIGYFRILQFQEGTARELEQAYNKMAKKHPVDGVIIDLRDNLGGLLDEAIAVTDLFLYEGVMVATKSRLQGEDVFNADSDGLPKNLRVIALTNHMSASAAEIVAGALQDSKRGLLVGSQTYGKGSVQSLYSNPDDSALKLTIGAYFTPSGEPVAPREGRTPDIEVAPLQQAGPRDTLEARLQNLEITSTEMAELLVLLDQIPRDSQPVPLPWSAPFAERRNEPQLARAIAELSP